VEPLVDPPPSTGEPAGAPAGTAAPGPGASGWRRLATPLGIGAVAACGCLAVAAADPGDDGVPLCWSRTLFGVDCPLCGGLRTANSLLRADASAALDHNVLLAVALPLVTLLWAWWFVRSWRGEDAPVRRPPAWILWSLGALVVAFGVVRNLTGPAWARWLHSDTWAG
jgi:hypothetical protein